MAGKSITMSVDKYFTIEEYPDRTNISFRDGNFSELEFKVLKLRKGIEAHFDLRNLKYLNSTLIRDWIQWGREYTEEKWFFYNCMPAFINQLNMIDKFLPRRSRIESLYVPYYSKSMDEEKFILLTRADHYPTGNSVQLPEVLDENGETMEVDVLPEKFFRFLYIY